MKCFGKFAQYLTVAYMVDLTYLKEMTILVFSGVSPDDQNYLIECIHCVIQDEIDCKVR